VYSIKHIKHAKYLLLLHHEQIKINHNNNFKIKLIKKFFLTPFNIEYITLTLNVSTHWFEFSASFSPNTTVGAKFNIMCHFIIDIYRSLFTEF